MNYIAKHKILFYFLQWTWGILMNVLGLLITLVLVCCGKKIEKHNQCFHIKIGKCWGGVSFGMFFFTGKETSEHTKDHETGHALQNCLWGLLFPIVIAVPSVIRYWYRKYLKWKYQEYSNFILKPYDSIWFENQASKWGSQYFK